MIATLDEVTEFPLCWPDNKPRCAKRVGSPFSTSMAKAQAEIRNEIPRWRVRHWVVSMAPQYRQGAVDPGVAIWWNHPMHVEQRTVYDLRVLACDTYTEREANLHAIALTFERLRSLERYGTYSMEQAIEGARLALPAPEGDRPIDWKSVLGPVPPITKDQQLVLVEHAYRSKSREANGDQDAQRRLNLAVEAARKELAP